VAIRPEGNQLENVKRNKPKITKMLSEKIGNQEIVAG